jgi:hypothetical protein
MSFTGDAPFTVPPAVRIMTFDREVACETLQAGTPADVSRVLEDGGWLATVDRLGASTVDVQFAPSMAPAVRHRVVQGHGRAGMARDARGLTRLVLTRTGWERPVFHLAVGTTQGPVLATLEGGGAVDRLRVCAASPARLRFAGGMVSPIPLDADANFGAGWHEAERSGSTRFRWADRVATLLLPIDEAAGVTVTLRLQPASPDGTTVHAAFNDRGAGVCTLTPGRWTDCDFTAPREAVRAGVNRLRLTSTTAVTPVPGGREGRTLAYSTGGASVRLQR